MTRIRNGGVVANSFGNVIAKVTDNTVTVADGAVVAHVSPLGPGRSIEVRMPHRILGFIDVGAGHVVQVTGLSRDEVEAGELIGTTEEARIAFPNAQYEWIALALLFIDRRAVELLAVERAVKSLQGLSGSERAALTRILDCEDRRTVVAPRTRIPVGVAFSRRTGPTVRRSTEVDGTTATAPQRGPQSSNTRRSDVLKRKRSHAPVGIAVADVKSRRRR